MKSLQYIGVLVLCVTLTQCNHLTDSETPTEAVDPRSRDACSIDKNTTCSSIGASERYSMQINVANFYTYKEITVKVHKTLCELSDVLSPWWYELQVIEDLKSSVPGSVVPPSSATGASAGEFKTVPSKTEIKFCKDNSTVVFSSCSPSPLDLPRVFTWKVLDQYKYGIGDTICFRLTFQLDGEDICSQKDECVSIGDIPTIQPTFPSVGSDDDVSSGTDVGSGTVAGSGTDAGSGNVHTYFEKVIEVENVDVGEFDYIIDEDLDDEETLMEILGESSEDHDDVMIVPSEKGCFVARSFFTENGLPWSPDCDCEGYYKRVQCLQGGTECWCSTRSGSEIQNSRRTLNCTDPQSFEFKC